MSAEAATIANALRLASGCLRDASLLAVQGSRNAAYLAEQALEQIIRAVATSEQIHIQRGNAHQLDKIIRSFPVECAVVPALRALTWLEAYATTFRYTSPGGRIPASPSPARLVEALESLNVQLQRMAAHFEVDLDRQDLPAGSTAPFR